MRIIKPTKPVAVSSRTLALSIFLFHGGFGAAAAQDRAALQQIRDACGADRARLCPGFYVSPRGVLRCLLSHQHEVSATCRAGLCLFKVPNDPAGKVSGFGGAAADCGGAAKPLGGTNAPADASK